MQPFGPRVPDPRAQATAFDWRAFNHLTRLIFEATDEEGIVQKFLKLLPVVLPVSFCAVSLRPHGSAEYWRAVGYRNGRSLSARLLDTLADASARKLAHEVFPRGLSPSQTGDGVLIHPHHINLYSLNPASLLAVPIQTARSQFGILLVGGGAEAYYSTEERSHFCLLAGQLAQALETARLYTQTRERDREFALIYQTGQRITQLLDLTQLTSQLAKAVSETFGYESVTLLLADEEAGELVVEDTYGLSKERHMGFRIPVTDELRGGIVGSVAYTGKPYMVLDVCNEERYIKTVRETRSELAVPLMIKGRVIGVLDVQSTKVNGFTENDCHILEMLADQIAIALENARLYKELANAHAEIQQTSKQLQRLLERTVTIQEQERRRIAGDIHDNANQLLYGAVYEAQALLHALPSAESPVNENLRNIQDTLTGALSEVRKAIFNLWPTSLDEIGLLPSLQSYLSTFEKETGMVCKLRVEGSPISFEPLARINIYRIIQEALHNVQRHSHAGRVELCFYFDSVPLLLEVWDDGVGFDWEKLVEESDRHLGLINMRERARTIGGQLDVESEPNKGTLLRFRFPRDAVEQASPANYD